MEKKRWGFTLIELIIVVVIVGILAMVAIPKYFANIKKAERAWAYSNLAAIREAMMGYYAANGSLPSFTAPANIIVTVDGDAVMTTPVRSGFSYASNIITSATTNSGCIFTMQLDTGIVGNGTGSAANCNP